MAGFRIDLFGGLRPKLNSRKLKKGEAQTALNVKLGSGDLEPIPEKATTQAVSSGRSSRSIYKFDNSGSPIWFEWDDVVDVVRGPVKDDTLERTYYTGDSTGTGAPKLTTNALADQGGGGPYPEGWLYVGVPAPELAPTITPTALPEDADADDRLASNIKTDDFSIDTVRWVTYPGTGTRNQTWRPDATGVGDIQFLLEPGMSFRVLSVINANKVTLESATEPGISLRTAASSLDDDRDWHMMDEQGTTQQARFIGWRVPTGMQVTIPGHNLAVGDVITVSATNQVIELPMGTSTDFYEQSWPTPTAISNYNGTYYTVDDALVTASVVSGTTPWTLRGSFYYDVDRAGSLASELEDRSYVYTYVNGLGEEGPPSPASTFQTALDGHDVLISGLSLPPTIGYDIQNIRIYRTNSTEAGTEFQFVKEIAVARSTVDNVYSEDLGEVISTTAWDPPPTGMQGITTMPNGMLVGFKGKQLYFCEPYFPHAWPADYDQAVDYDIVGLAAFGNSVVALTEGWPYIVTGSHPRNTNVRPVKVNHACVSKQSIATGNDRVYYASPDGLVEIGVNGIRLVTEDLMDKEDWETYQPSTLVSEFYEDRYYGFYDFDVSVIDHVRTAEVSGTITDAEETDIINGGLTIILTLTNDSWLSAGTSFNNQRQNIIDGLTASTSQTLGWNNLVRDTALTPTDVVRTNDSVVTITLPTVAGYAITSAETIQPTIPASALTISDSAITTQTFSIQPDEHLATVTLSGTLDGAAEADIVSGGKTIIITLTNDTWQTTLTDAMKQGIIDGLTAATNEQDGWNDNVTQEIATSAVVRTSDTVVTVTLPAVANYAVTANESISASIPYGALTQHEANANAASSNSLGIIATGVASAIFSGTAVSGGVTENEIVAGGETVIITLTNDTWVAAGTGPIGSTANTQALIDALIAQTSQTLGWNNVVQVGIETADVVRTSDTVCTITLDAESTYSIASNETIGCTIPAAVLTGAAAITVSNTFGITAQTPVTAVMSGTLVSSSPTEADIVAGGKTIILTLSDDTWLAAGTGPIGSTANTQAIIDGIVAATSPTNGWNNELIGTGGSGSLGTSDVVRTSDTVCTITLPADAQYDITANETITATIPAAALNISASAVVASPTATVSYIVGATAAITGTATASINETDVKTGGKTIIITLSDDTWVASGAAFDAVRQDIIDGLDSAQSEAGGWNNKVRDVMAVTTVVRTSDSVCTITLPATADYAIDDNETITVTVPASALVLSSSAVTGDSTFGILAQVEPTTAVLSGTVTASIDEDDIVAGGKTIILTLSDDTWLAAGTGPIGSTANTQAIIDGIVAATSPTNGWNNELIGSGGSGSLGTSDVVRTSDTVCTITLPADAEYDITHSSTETITATIPAAALNISSSAVVATPTFTIDSVAPPATTAAVTGTATASIVEADVVTGGKTIIITLTNDTWLAAGTGPIGSTANTQAIIDGLDAAADPVNGWNAEVRDIELSTTDVVRTSDTVCTITLPAASGYDITAQETITVTVPAEALNTSAIAVTATPTFTVDYSANVALTNYTGLKGSTSGGGYIRNGFQFMNDGSIVELGAGATESATLDRAEWWTDQPSAGIGASYEVRFTGAAIGSWSTEGAADNTWVGIDTEPYWVVFVPPHLSPSTKICQGDFEIRLASTGSALDSATFRAEARN